LFDSCCTPSVGSMSEHMGLLCRYINALLIFLELIDTS